MRRLVIVGMLTIACANSAIAERQSTLNMTCSEADALITSAGQIVLTTGANTFNRFVTSRGFCRAQEHTEPGYARTSDRNRCRLHYVSKPGRTQFKDFD